MLKRKKIWSLIVSLFWFSGWVVLLCLGMMKVYPWFARAANYEKLERFLKDKNWVEADRETSQLLLQISRRNFLPLYYVFPDLYDFDTIPCQPFQIIDELWSEHSGGKFGLGAQASIWHNRVESLLDQNFNRPNEDFSHAFDVFVKDIQWGETPPETLSNAAIGEFPSPNWMGEGQQDGEDIRLVFRAFYLRVKDCGISPPGRNSPS